MVVQALSGRRAAVRRPALAVGRAAQVALGFALLAGVGLLGGCGRGGAGDIFIVTRAVSTPHAGLDPVDEEGNVHCNGRAAPRKLSDAELVRARGIQEDLQRRPPSTPTWRPGPAR